MAGNQKVTEVRVLDANCPICLEETKEALSHEPGVRRVATDLSAGCIKIEHQNVGEERLVERLSRVLRRYGSSNHETTMMGSTIEVTGLDCDH